MRRHFDRLKWSLGLVCVAFVLFYIPDFLRGTGADAAAGDTIAKVEGHEITAGGSAASGSCAAYCSAAGAFQHERSSSGWASKTRFSSRWWTSRPLWAEAGRVGVSVSDEEVRQRIFATPAFQENGAFIGEARYQQLLRAQRPPDAAVRVRGKRPQPADGRKAARLADRLDDGGRQRARAGIPAPQRQGQARGRQLARRHVPHFQVNATDAESAPTSTATRTISRFPRSGRSGYLLIDVEALRAKVVIPPADVERATTTASSRSTRHRSRFARATSSSRPREKTMRP